MISKENILDNVNARECRHPYDAYIIQIVNYNPTCKNMSLGTLTLN